MPIASRAPHLAHDGVGGEFRGDGGAAPAHHRERGENRTQLAHDHDDHELADQVGGARPAPAGRSRLEMTRKLRMPLSRTTSGDRLEGGEAELVEQHPAGDPAPGAGQGRRAIRGPQTRSAPAHPPGRASAPSRGRGRRESRHRIRPATLLQPFLGLRCSRGRPRGPCCSTRSPWPCRRGPGRAGRGCSR